MSHRNIGLVASFYLFVAAEADGKYLHIFTHESNDSGFCMLNTNTLNSLIVKNGWG